MNNNKCLKCGKTLKAIGDNRKNGKSHKDWNTRQYHKKCWLDYIIIKDFIEREINKPNDL